jgi:hypothetical protein
LSATPAPWVIFRDRPLTTLISRWLSCLPRGPGFEFTAFLTDALIPIQGFTNPARLNSRALSDRTASHYTCLSGCKKSRPYFPSPCVCPLHIHRPHSVGRGTAHKPVTDSCRSEFEPWSFQCPKHTYYSLQSGARCMSTWSCTSTLDTTPARRFPDTVSIELKNASPTTKHLANSTGCQESRSWPTSANKRGPLPSVPALASRCFCFLTSPPPPEVCISKYCRINVTTLPPRSSHRVVWYEVTKAETQCVPCEVRT